MSKRNQEVDTLIWLVGRGASIACGLCWTEPPSWADMPRQDRICRIKQTLRLEMCKSHVSIEPYRRLVQYLENHTAASWRHRFVTTNWDTLLQKVLDELYPSACPSQWLRDTYVSHLNGSVSRNTNPDFHSDFLLEDDPRGSRREKPQSNMIYNRILVSAYFVILGMSFECQTDASLLRAVQSADMRAQRGTWLLVNPSRSSLEQSCSTVKTAMPACRILPVQRGMVEWIEEGLPDLIGEGILTT